MSPGLDRCYIGVSHVAFNSPETPSVREAACPTEPQMLHSFSLWDVLLFFGEPLVVSSGLGRCVSTTQSMLSAILEGKNTRWNLEFPLARISSLCFGPWSKNKVKLKSARNTMLAFGPGRSV